MKRAGLDLGPEVVRLLLPHRPPLLLVDRITGFEADPGRIRAERAISLSDPVFAGHLPDLAIWPGVYTIEGLAQASSLLLTLEQAAAASPGVLLALRRYEQARRLEPVTPEEGDRALLEGLAAQQVVGVLAAVDVKLLAPVFPGTLLGYESEVAERVQGLVRLRVEATDRGRVVARGTLTVAPGRGR